MEQFNVGEVLTSFRLNNLLSEVENATQKIGNIEDLKTENKQNLVSAINEAATKGGSSEAIIIDMEYRENKIEKINNFLEGYCFGDVEENAIDIMNLKFIFRVYYNDSFYQISEDHICEIMYRDECYSATFFNRNIVQEMCLRMDGTFISAE